MFFVKNIPDNKSTLISATNAYSELPNILTDGTAYGIYLGDLEDNISSICHPTRLCEYRLCSAFRSWWERGAIYHVNGLVGFSLTMLSPRLNSTAKCRQNGANMALSTCKACGSYIFGTLATDVFKLNAGVSCPLCNVNWSIGSCFDCGKSIEKNESRLELSLDIVRRRYSEISAAAVHTSCIKNRDGIKCLNAKCDNWLYYCERTLPWVCADHRTNPVQSHDFRPQRWVALGKGDLFGIEIEVMPASGVGYNANSRNYYAAVAGNLSPSVFVKHDGSVDLGFEVVTHPINYGIWQGDSADIKNVQRVFSFLTRKYTSFSDPACGLHVHCNVGDFANNDHIARFATFIMYQPYFCSLIGERTSRSYSKFSRAVADSTASRLAGGTRPDRYTAVNVQPAAPTVEVRMFKGNLKWERILKDIEFCRALRVWTSERSMGDVVSVDGPSNFMKWAEEKEYKHLTSFVAAQPKLIRSFI